MKHRAPLLPRRPAGARTAPADALKPLLEAMLAMRSPAELRAFLDDLCTPAEPAAV